MLPEPSSLPVTQRWCLLAANLKVILFCTGLYCISQHGIYTPLLQLRIEKVVGFLILGSLEQCFLYTKAATIT